MLIQYTPEEIEECRNVANLRNTKKKGVPSLRVHQGATDYAIHFWGLLGEKAFSIYYGVDIDTTHNEGGGDRGYDFIINEKTIDIKYSRSKSNCLIVSSKGRVKADILVLAKPYKRGNPLEGTKLVGWITREEFLERAEYRMFWDRRALCFPQRNLKKMPTLKRYLKGGK